MFYSVLSPYCSQNSSISGFMYSRACEVAKSTGANLALKVLSLSPNDPTILLRDAVLAGSATRVKLAFAAGADPNTPDKDGETPLHRACYHRNIDAVRFLLDKGANPNIQAKDDGITPLHGACLWGQIDATQLLLQNGADPNIQNKHGYTPLHVAIDGGYSDAARLLLQNGADPNIQNKDGYTPLHIAIDGGHIDAARLLLENGVDPNIQDKYGDTPLHIAYLWGHIDAAHLLLDKGADLNIQNKDGDTPFHLACEYHPRDVVECLVDFKAKQSLRRNPVPFLFQRELGQHKSYIDSHNFFHFFLNQQNKKGQTPLHLAVKAGNKDVVEYLLENGAQIPPDADGETPLDLAFVDSNILDLFKKHTGWANEAAVAHAFEKRNFPALLFMLELKPLLSSELRAKILADAQATGKTSIINLIKQRGF